MSSLYVCRWMTELRGSRAYGFFTVNACANERGLNENPRPYRAI